MVILPGCQCCGCPVPCEDGVTQAVVRMWTDPASGSMWLPGGVKPTIGTTPDITCPEIDVTVVADLPGTHGFYWDGILSINTSNRSNDCWVSVDTYSLASGTDTDARIIASTSGCSNSIGCREQVTCQVLFRLPDGIYITNKWYGYGYAAGFDAPGTRYISESYTPTNVTNPCKSFPSGWNKTTTYNGPTEVGDYYKSFGIFDCVRVCPQMQVSVSLQ